MVFDLLVIIVVTIIYLTALWASVVFAWSLDRFLKLEDTLCADLAPELPICTIDTNFDKFDSWLKRHHRTVGVLLVIGVLVDLQLVFFLRDMMTILCAV
jgi:hypothetical protein